MYKQALVNILLKQAAEKTLEQYQADDISNSIKQNGTQPKSYYYNAKAEALTPETKTYSQQDMYDAVKANYDTQMKAVHELAGKYQAEYDKRAADDARYTEDSREKAIAASMAAMLGGSVLGTMASGLSYLGGDYLTGGVGTGIKPKAIAGTALAGTGGLAGYGLARGLGYGKKGRIIGTLLGSAGLPVLSSLAATDRMSPEILGLLGMGSGIVGGAYLAHLPFRNAVAKRKAETEEVRQAYNKEIAEKTQAAENYLAAQEIKNNFD